MKRRALLAAAITLASTTEADAQACLGRAAFSSGAVRTSIGYQSVNWYGGEIAVGSAQSGFGAARFETYQPGHSSSASTFSSTRMLVSGGTQVRVGRAQFCPIAGLGHANSESSFDSRRLESTVRRYEIGGAIGTSTGARDDVHVIPSLAIKYVLESASGTITTAGIPSRFNNRGTSHGESVWSLGFAYGSVAVTPFVVAPFGIRFLRTDWGVHVSYNFGRR